MFTCSCDSRGTFGGDFQITLSEEGADVETPFYLDGPQQARPADGVLAVGARVTLVQEAGSYTQVTLPDGRRAYVAADSLKALR